MGFWGRWIYYYHLVVPAIGLAVVFGEGCVMAWVDQSELARIQLVS